MPEKKRALNMEEKRNLQKLIFADIAAASAKHKAARDKERTALQEELVAKASPEVRELVVAYHVAVAKVENAEKQLSDLGYHITKYSDEPKLSIAYGKGPHELVGMPSRHSKVSWPLSENGSNIFPHERRSHPPIGAPQRSHRR
jgi:hypothetical protein